MLNEPGGISPLGGHLSRGSAGERVNDRPRPRLERGSQGVPRRRHRGDNRTGARVSEPDIQPGRGTRLGFPLREPEQVRGGPTAALHRGADRVPAAFQSAADLPAERILAGDEDIVRPDRPRGAVPDGGGAGGKKSVAEYGDAELPEEATPYPATLHRQRLTRQLMV